MRTTHTLQLPKTNAQRAIHNTWHKAKPWLIAALLFTLWGLAGAGDVDMELATAQSTCEAKGQTLTEVSHNTFECATSIASVATAK